jgi:hypothetical protein
MSTSSTSSPSKEQLYRLIDQLSDAQTQAVLAFVQVLSMDPVSRAILLAPCDDEPVTPEEEAEVARAMHEPTVNVPVEDLLKL